MNAYELLKEELDSLQEKYKEITDKKAAEKLKTVYALGVGKNVQEICNWYWLSESTVRSYFYKYKSGGIEELLKNNHQGSVGYLVDKELEELKIYIEQSHPQNAKEVVNYVEEHYGIRYTLRGMQMLLNKLSYSYKQKKKLPGPLEKINEQAQENFIVEFNKILNNKEIDIYFIDAMHPQHNVKTGRAWIKKGLEFFIPEGCCSTPKYG